METSCASSLRHRMVALFRSTRVAFIALSLGLAQGNAQSSTAAAPAKLASAMHSFVIIFRQGPHTYSEADLKRRAQEVSAWAGRQNAAGHKLEPRILGPDVS